MTLEWEGEEADRQAAAAARAEHDDLLQRAVGEPVVIANEFAEVRVQRVETRNGSRLMIESPKSGQWITLDPLELESLTWQTADTFSAMIGRPFGPLFQGDEL